jgi:hypothetical protein
MRIVSVSMMVDEGPLVGLLRSDALLALERRERDLAVCAAAGHLRHRERRSPADGGSPRRATLAGASSLTPRA